ncbi:MAG TPA: tetratricopeptide repeat protein [Vicinamibacteria bacterium]|nr:tetratricopeptide repeat protein [Vicinamibacteria bacterium]
MIRRRTAVAAILLCSLACTSPDPEPLRDAQQGPETTESAEQISDQARELYSKVGPSEALPLFERALELYRRDGDRRGEAVTLGLIGNCHKGFGDFPKALEFLRTALRMKREIGEKIEVGKTLNHLGLVHWEMGDYPIALDFFEESLALARELHDRQLAAAVLNNISLVYDERGDYRRSLEQYQLALALHREEGFEPGESDALGNIGGVHLLLGQYREATRYYQQALAISERLELKPSASKDLGNLATCYLNLGDPPEALATFDRALAVAREAGLTADEAEWLRGKGAAWVEMGQYDRALDALAEALTFYELAGAQRERIEALHQRGSLRVLLGDLGSAEQDFRKAMDEALRIGHPRGVTTASIALGDLELRRKRFDRALSLYGEALASARASGERAQVAATLIELALAYREQGRLAEAMGEAREALGVARAIEARSLESQALLALAEATREAGNSESALEPYEAALTIATELRNPELEWRTTYGRGQALEALGRPHEALASYRLAAATIEDVRGRLQEEQFRAGYIEDKYEVYVALVRLQLLMGAPPEAFLYAEKLRARRYLETLRRGLPPIRGPAHRQAEVELSDRVRKLQQSLMEEEAKPASEQRPEALATFGEELAEAERAYRDLVVELRKTDPEYALARELTVPSAEEVQRRLPVDTALLEYVIDKDALTVFVLTSERTRAITVPLDSASLQAKVELLRELVARPPSNDWKLPAESLRNILIQPVEDEGWLRQIEKIYLAPHGILHYLPFPLLLRSRSGEVRFLMEDYVLSLIPAASSLVYGAARNGTGKTILAVSPAGARLAFGEEEARRVGALFAGHSVVLAREQATESSFKRIAARYDVIHLATHGYLNERDPLLSGIDLEPDAGEDGRLEVHEILELRLKAGLVTLSACETALGGGYFTDVPAGDDFVGLTRAFLFAGSPSVLASLWKVDDRSTFELMEAFYRARDRAETAESLAAAQRAMRQAGGRYSHPYFWAAFVLVGRM